MAEETKPAEDKPSTATDREEGEVSPNRDGEPDFSQKHPLETRWTLWFDNPKGSQSKGVAWGQTLRAVYSFDSVEDFWCLYNNIKPPSFVSAGTDFHLFREGIEPKWEDPKCEGGGKWTVLVPKGGQAGKSLDKFWVHGLLACIGEQFSESEEICGIVVNVRAKQDKICLWTKTASNEAVQVSIGKTFKEVLDVPDNVRIGYLTHSDAKALDRKAKDRYTV